MEKGRSLSQEKWQEHDMQAIKAHPAGFYQLDPIPSPETLSDFYQSQYYDLLRKGGRAPELKRLTGSNAERSGELAWLEATLYEDVADLVRPHMAAGGNVLDIGCGTGDLISFLSRKGFTASGLEPSPDAVEAARSRGADVHCGTVESWVSDPGHHEIYNAVVMMNVLEHVPDPVAVLENVRKLLIPGGALVFRVPNDFTAIQAAAEETGVERKKWWVAVPDHINYFRFDTVGAACSGAGLKVVDITADFPMEFFLLMGLNYIDHPEKGGEAHQMRRNFEMNMPKAMRQSLYRALAAEGMGRNILVTALRE